jgi:hypothetical protein
MTVRHEFDTAWLLLTFTLPAKRASQRVEVWRKLQRYGTVPLGNSGYLLPSGSSNEERFQWLATAVRKHGGDASVVRVESIDNLTPAQLRARFCQVRDREYQDLVREIQKVSVLLPSGKAEGRLGRLRIRFQEIVEVDFFGSPMQGRVRELLKRASLLRKTKTQLPRTKVNPKDYKGRRWVTRPRPGVDRCASAWLIRKFIDPKAQFTFAPEHKAPPTAVPFDMFHGEGFSHSGDDCTFETLIKAFHISDKRVVAMGEIVHDSDLCDGKFGRKEGFGIDEVLKGWARQDVSDAELLERGMQLAEGLYQSLPKR